MAVGETVLTVASEGETVVVAGQDDLAQDQQVDPQPRNGGGEDEPEPDPAEEAVPPAEEPDSSS